ncbi:hypothetical protein MES5069_310068 [Mesorhizobium escarrei]|uniref:Uncharacterized protein n=1 Tax=Mesorhizobium escarrei TaxID=666018 RepID=A0ABN8JWX1_9HYPH|nr:hypothetical protein MES5069_310068 [Mesorhizobium escarrei]
MANCNGEKVVAALSVDPTQATEYPALVNRRHVTIPFADTALGCAEAPYGATPDPFVRRGRDAALRRSTLQRVEPLVFSDVPYSVEDHARHTCFRSDLKGFFMNEIRQADGSSRFKVSDSGLGTKAVPRAGEDRPHRSNLVTRRERR